MKIDYIPPGPYDALMESDLQKIEKSLPSTPRDALEANLLWMAEHELDDTDYYGPRIQIGGGLIIPDEPLKLLNPHACQIRTELCICFLDAHGLNCFQLSLTSFLELGIASLGVLAYDRAAQEECGLFLFQGRPGRQVSLRYFMHLYAGRSQIFIGPLNLIFACFCHQYPSLAHSFWLSRSK